MDWQEVAIFHDPIQAEIARGFLEAQGIPVRLLQEGAARALGVYLGAFGSIRLLVPEDLVETSRRLLGEMEAGLHEQDLPPWLPPSTTNDEPPTTND